MPKKKKNSHFNNPQIVVKRPRWLKDLRKRIEKGFGSRCPDFCYGCGICMAWLSYDILDDLFGWEWKEKKNEKNKR